MTPEESTHTAAPAVAVVTPRRRFSIIWLIPLVAALIGGWLAVKTIIEQGPEVTITFRSAEGLEAGKTKIRYKEVEVGKIEGMRVSDDLSQVIVTARMAREATPFLTTTTRFWIVRARVSTSEVSGLSTLFSGAYIGVDPGLGGEPARTFTGLEEPPVITTDQPGRHFLLRADSLGSLGVGSPIYFRQIRVGEVERYELEPDGEHIRLGIFIRAPYDKHVRAGSRFWNASGVDVSLDTQGLQFRSESLATLLVGGIAFDTPRSLDQPVVAKDGEQFWLYPDRKSSLEPVYLQRDYLVLHFSSSVRGLSVGAPVEFRGIVIGKVAEIRLQYDHSGNGFKIPVLVYLEPERIEEYGKKVKRARPLLDELVAMGLRAQLRSSSLLTGQLYVDLDFHPKDAPRVIDYSGQYPVFPTVPPPLEELTASLERILNRLDKVPFEAIGGELNATLGVLKRNLEQSEQMLTDVNATILPELQQTLQGIQRVMNEIDERSSLQLQTRQTLEDLGGAARAVRNLADYLERHPEALLRGKGEEP